MNDTTEENKAAQHIEEMHEFIAENQRLIESLKHNALTQSVRDEAYEAAAKVCDRLTGKGGAVSDELSAGKIIAAAILADAIRGLIGK